MLVKQPRVWERGGRGRLETGIPITIPSSNPPQREERKKAKEEREKTKREQERVSRAERRWVIM